MQNLPSIVRPPKSKTLISLLSVTANLSPLCYHTFALSLLETHKHLQHFNQILSHAVTSGRFTDPFLSSKLLHRSLSDPDIDLDFSRSLFFQIRNPNAYAWNFMLRAYSHSSSPEEAIGLFNRMRRRGTVPDKYTFPFVLKACGRVLALEKGLEFHCLIVKLGLETDVFVQNALISMYFQCGNIQIAKRAFDMVPDSVRDVVTWNTVISGYVQSDCCNEALKVFDELLNCGKARLNEVTLVSVLTACGRIKTIDLGRKIHGFSIVNGSIMDVFIGSSLIDMYTKCFHLETARKVFDTIPERNIVTWTSMIAGYARSDSSNEAIELFREMHAHGVKPDSATVASVLSACGQAGAFDQGSWVHSYCKKNNIVINLTVSNALIDMYSKCGDFRKALKIFHGLTIKDVYSWTAMISGLAINGESHKALSLFRQMIDCSNVRPNEVTFLGVLHACSHGGFVEKGFYYFELMRKLYDLDPRIEHYGCIVDLLCRANLLVEAKKFIKSIPIEPDAVMWRSLLFACRVQGNVELAEIASMKVEELEPQKCGARVLLSNVYASTSRWGDARRVRKMMSFEGIRKEPGWSYLEIDGRVHEFLAGDDSHCLIDLVYRTVVETVMQFESFDSDYAE